MNVSVLMLVLLTELEQMPTACFNFEKVPVKLIFYKIDTVHKRSG